MLSRVKQEKSFISCVIVLFVGYSLALRLAPVSSD